MGYYSSFKKKQTSNTYNMIESKKLLCWTIKAGHQALYYPYKVQVTEIRTEGWSLTGTQWNDSGMKEMFCILIGVSVYNCI